jgi:hypothetical protein
MPTPPTGPVLRTFNLTWNYEKGFLDISMPGYVPKALHALQHPPPAWPQHSPHRWSAPVYGQKLQLANTDLTPLLDKAGIHRVQQISGLFLYYSRGCDPTIIVALNEISNLANQSRLQHAAQLSFNSSECHYPLPRQ